MKKFVILLVIMSLVLVSNSYADLAWVGTSYVVVNSTWFDGSASAQENDFNGYNFGTISSLVLGGEVQSWDMSGDVAYLGYIIDSSDPAYISLTWSRQEGSNDLWQSSPGSTVDMSSLSAGEHTLSVWFWVHDSDLDVNAYDNNGGSNYSATFTIEEDPATPITLSSFSAEAKKGVVELAWTTASEVENSYFIVYRDGEKIAQIDGVGTSTETHDYIYVDKTVLPGIHEYVLADVNYDGDVIEHPAVEVELSTSVVVADYVLNNAYPNPFNPRTAISYELSEDGNLNLSIYNTSGELVKTLFNGEHAAGSYEINWDASNMPSGVYILNMTAGNTMSSQKLILMK